MTKQSTLGSCIRTLRMQNNMTQARLAEKLGVTDKAVSKWERDLSYPDMALFPVLANSLGVTADDLLSGCGAVGKSSRLLQIFGMTHDVRTPLHIILGCVNMAENHRDDPALLERYLENIRISGEYLLRSIDYLMQVAKPDQEDIPDKPYPSNITELGEYLNKRAEARKKALSEHDFSGRRILVAEDIRINREIAAEILRHAGAEVEFAENGAVCLAMIKEQQPGYYDLILMDIMMPEMDGIEAARRIRALTDPLKASVPIIAVSANVSEKEKKAALSAGMNAFAEKPVMIDKLFEEMERYLGGGPS